MPTHPSHTSKGRQWLWMCPEREKRGARAPLVAFPVPHKSFLRRDLRGGGRWTAIGGPGASPSPSVSGNQLARTRAAVLRRDVGTCLGARFPVACLQQCPTEHRGPWFVRFFRARRASPSSFQLKGGARGSGRETLRRCMILSIQICTQLPGPSNDPRGIYPKDKVTLHYETLGPSTARIPALTRMEARPLDRSAPSGRTTHRPPSPYLIWTLGLVFTSLEGEGGGWEAGGGGPHLGLQRLSRG